MTLYLGLLVPDDMLIKKYVFPYKYGLLISVYSKLCDKGK